MEFGILGPLAVWQEGRELELGAPKQRALLAVLLLHAGETMATPRLVDALWGERPPARAVKALQVHISQLRKVLGEGVVETRPLGYLVRVDDGALDLQRFERLLDKGRQLLADGAGQEAGEVLRKALGLWRGAALADFRYEAFATSETGRLEELRLVTLELRLEADLAVGRHAEAVPELETLVREHPLRENLRALLILALYRAGRQADALAVMQRTRATLRDELGLDPSQALQRLEKAILLQDPSLDLAAETLAPPVPAPVVRPRPATPPSVCATCGATNSYRADYCRSCGAPLASDPSIQTRKTVTVLFCDVVAYTELAGRLDPETLRHVMSRFFELAAGTIERHGGTVEKFIGDEVMAVFGVPAVREDDALRAARAAIELRERIPGLETELGSGAHIEVRIGINTGEVVAGDPAAGHGFVTGEAVAVGKRLQQAAAAGEVLLGIETHTLIAHAVGATPLGPLSVKGRHDELAAFRLEFVDAEATALPRRDDAPLVGRSSELEWLHGLYAQVASGDGARHATIVGEPGIGKSRLAREFVAAVSAEATVLVGRCPPYGEAITFWPLREVLRQAGRGEDELAGSSHEVFADARRVLSELAAERPVVTVFEDVHWAEPTFLDLVEYLGARLGDAPVLVLCLTRPELTEWRPAWLQEPAAALALGPLSEAKSEELLEGLGVPVSVRRRIAETAEGNPLFVEQLAAITDAAGTNAMPSSIRAVLHERLDRLDPSERSVLERAATAGRSFSLELVLDLAPEGERDTVYARLLALVRKRFIQPDHAMPDEGFRFHHALIRDAAYDGIPKRIRADLHERVATRLEAQAADDALVGYHLENSFRLRKELGSFDADLGTRAGRLLGKAGREALARGDVPAAKNLLDRATALLPEGDDLRTSLLPDLGAALRESGELSRAEEVVRDAIDEAKRSSNPSAELAGNVELALLRLLKDPRAPEVDRLVSHVEQATPLLVGSGNDRVLAQAWTLIGLASGVWKGRHAHGEEALQRALLHARSAGDHRQEAVILGRLAFVTTWGPTPVSDAIVRCTEMLELALGDRLVEADVTRCLAALHARQSEFDEARELAARAREGYEELGMLLLANVVRAFASGDVELLAGDYAAAERELRTAYGALETMGERAYLSTVAALLSRALYGQGALDEALATARAAQASAATHDLWSQVLARGPHAKALARRGSCAEAEIVAREAVQIAAQTDALELHGNALLDLADVLRTCGADDEAALVARKGLELLELKGVTVLARSAGELSDSR